MRLTVHQCRYATPLLLGILILPNVLASQFITNTKVINYLGHRYFGSSQPNQGLVQNTLLSIRKNGQGGFLSCRNTASTSTKSRLPWNRGGRNTLRLEAIPSKYYASIEQMWELYKNRDDYMPELQKNALMYMKKNTLRAVGIIGVSYIATDFLARLGVIGDKGEGLVDYAKDERVRLRKLAREELREHMPGLIARLRPVDRFLNMPDKSKFAVAMSFGTLFAQTAVTTSVLLAKATISAFVVVEILSFSGVIGESGESVTEWIEDNSDKFSTYIFKAQKFRKTVRNHCDIQSLQEMYMDAVTDEKYASMGLAIGSLIGVLGLV